MVCFKHLQLGEEVATLLLIARASIINMGYTQIRTEPVQWD